MARTDEERYKEMTKKEDELERMQSQTVLKIIEDFITSFILLKENTSKIIPLMRDVGKENMADIFETSIVFFEAIGDKKNENLGTLGLAEISLHQIFINHLNNWLHWWLISFEGISDENRKETSELYGQPVTEKDEEELTKLLAQLQDPDLNQDDTDNPEIDE